MAKRTPPKKTAPRSPQARAPLHRGAAVEPIRWKGDRLELLDQRVLPEKTVYVTCRNAAEVAQAIRDMVVRGAPAIGCAAAFGVALSKGSQDSFEILAKSRPTAVNLFWALERMKKAKDLEAEARAIFEADIAANREIGRLGAELIAERARIMTHCNAGALATAGYGTALGVIRSSKNKNISVIANETRPYLQGARLTAWELVQEGIPCTLITDSMAGHLMSKGEVDVVVVGADRIAANGDVANKIGTYALAVLAKRHDIPFYVAAPLSTFDPKIPDGSHIPIEERPAGEVTGYRGTRWAPEGVAVRNPAFDVTPADLITGIICEKGVVLAPNREKLEALIR
ncbi:MAG: S-methyl-5-thioribose-1-phosphate isomerase [Betaproteobacteria bacterium]|nr:MAG: S-methyl-5-thioribose-1-phosphate isomerase [Betaproteobacteria bacterium]